MKDEKKMNSHTEKFSLLKSAFLGAAVGIVLAVTFGCTPPVIPSPAPDETTGDGDGDDGGDGDGDAGPSPCPDVGDPAGDGDGDGDGDPAGDGDGDGECFPEVASHLCCIEDSPCLWSCVETLLNDPCPEGHEVIGAAP